MEKDGSTLPRRGLRFQMERFYNNNDEHDDEKESFFGSEDDDNFDDEDAVDEAIGFIDQQSILEVMQMDLTQSELNQNLLAKAIEFAKSKWFWSFKSNESRLKEIEMIYKRFSEMTESEQGPETMQIPKIPNPEREK